MPNVLSLFSEKTCGSPAPQFPFAKIKYSIAKKPNGYSLGTEAQYYCRGDHSQRIQSKYVCKENGNWDGEEPICCKFHLCVPVCDMIWWELQ